MLDANTLTQLLRDDIFLALFCILVRIIKMYHVAIFCCSWYIILNHLIIRRAKHPLAF
uniref:Uncharacterized protein n=1 Tax=Hyaloperonospora arabidopsidis (strain Emoy2) TaxID=559515 RepID=M4BNU7_HYAAE